MPGLALRRLLAGGTAGSGARLLQDGRVTGGGELAASVRGTLIGLKKGDKEGVGGLGRRVGGVGGHGHDWFDPDWVSVVSCAAQAAVNF